MTEANTYDAVVVGAGPNGLAAAVELARNSRSVAVLEAEERVGYLLRAAFRKRPAGGVTHGGEDETERGARRLFHRQKGVGGVASEKAACFLALEQILGEPAGGAERAQPETGQSEGMAW